MVILSTLPLASVNSVRPPVPTDERFLHRAVIAPVPEECDRPLWSVMIPTYNCAAYLRETLTSVLAQAPAAEEMQIEVVDDHSTQDDPAAVVAEVGQGRVEFYRQPQNVGYIRNFETCLQRSRGHLIHLLHGDDGVRDGFYQTMQRRFDEHPEMGAAFCRHIYMDEHGHWRRLSPLEQPTSGLFEQGLEKIVVRHPIQTPSIVVRRSVYEQLGGFDRRFSCCGEDWEMWVRIAAAYPVGYEVEPLAIYRSHSTSLSGRSVRSGQNIRDVRLASEIIEPYLPPAAAGQLSNKARELWALWGLHCARELLANRDVTGAIAQLQEALNCSRSPTVLFAAAQLSTRLGKRWLRQNVRRPNVQNARH
ncbi:glycosyltransferase [Oculatella sp. LEGE 06141]|uniref:glycosyltransferase family 2 protein n=1 Tax=Oculatella sp. LEGE 06141 TaxID=1828648 RepID=UPI0018812888|nr:glycosyltransferase [Oculatella sp. LEGE 06141]MBE9178458.1 glycosyltransferase [Oculatella sp. LEGE 06141]